MGAILGMLSQVIVVPIIFLTVSFFVLFAIRKVDTQGLKVFGIVICVLLWISTVLALSSGIYSLAKGYPMMKQRMQKGGPMQMMPQQQMQKGHMGHPQQQMQKGPMDQPQEQMMLR